MTEANREFKKRSGKRHFNRHDRRFERVKKEDIPVMICEICSKQIFDPGSAMANRESGQPVHFDCALARVTESEKLGPNERIAYIGHGNFAVIEFNDRSQSTFIIKRRIEWEGEQDKIEWRKLLQKKVATS